MILVSIDSLRADHCGYMGYGEGTTPTLDEMASDGVMYSNAIAPGPRTPESMPPIFTGRFPSDDLPAKMINQQTIIRDHMEKHITVAERFSAAGYRTVGITPNPFTSRFFGFDQGFDQFVDFLGEDRSGIYHGLFRKWLSGGTVSNVLRLTRNMLLREEVFKPWEAYYERIAETIQASKEPYFLWVFLMDVHEPYLAGDDYQSQSWLDRWRGIWRLYLSDRETPFDEATRDRLLTAYNDSIRYTDAFLERLLNDIEDNTLIAIHGDHGEAFGEHGYYSHEPYLYEESIHVPLVLHGLDQATIDKPTSLLDIPAILMNAIEGVEFEGSDLVESRTSMDDTTALRAKTSKFIDGSRTEELYRLENGEGTEIDNEKARLLFSRIVASRNESMRERRRIGDAAAPFLGDWSEPDVSL